MVDNKGNLYILSRTPQNLDQMEALEEEHLSRVLNKKKPLLGIKFDERRLQEVLENL